MIDTAEMLWLVVCSSIGSEERGTSQFKEEAERKMEYVHPGFTMDR